jgi:2-polyprenyl-6-methoxyphenol hydroxylase-like FAD-dependent oxidoreductase
MTGAYVLAGELSRAANDYREAFRRYEDRLRPLIKAKQKSARKFAGAFAPRTVLGIWMRNQATKLMRIPKVADMLILGEMRDDFDLPNYDM